MIAGQYKAKVTTASSVPIISGLESKPRQNEAGARPVCCDPLTINDTSRMEQESLQVEQKPPCHEPAALR